MLFAMNCEDQVDRASEKLQMVHATAMGLYFWSIIGKYFLCNNLVLLSIRDGSAQVTLIER